MAVPVQPALPRPVRVLVVDDSAFMRYSISQYLNERPDLQVVGAARDGKEALELIPRLDPDVVTLDVEMPRLDGLSTLREIMQRFPRPVVMLSSMTREGAAETIQALTLGAVDFVTKPTSNVNIRSVLDEAAQKILRAASARIRPVSLLVRRPPASTAEVAPKSGGRPLQRNDPVVLIGTSTGGPRALHEVVPALSADLPAAVVIVQHMPAGFTHSLAERLDSLSKLKVKEAQPGDLLLTGQALLAPGGFHMLFDENLKVTLNQNPTVHGVRPAVDVTLISLIQRFGRSVIAVILTGMGSDGTNGATLLHSMGGRVIAEHESTSVVWGMPRSVVEAGAADFVLPLPEVAARIEQLVQESRNG
uniref:Protein-glutamate methylesterase/protein-glutamine glutaminase n=1 Tax=Anaerolinea thermolimosa TaxID=229919 RepID=A0A7C4KJK0_9CHLR